MGKKFIKNWNEQIEYLQFFNSVKWQCNQQLNTLRQIYIKEWYPQFIKLVYAQTALKKLPEWPKRLNILCTINKSRSRNQLKWQLDSIQNRHQHTKRQGGCQHTVRLWRSEMSDNEISFTCHSALQHRHFTHDKCIYKSGQNWSHKWSEIHGMCHWRLISRK